MTMLKWLIEIRKKRGFTQKAVALQCGISQQYFSAIESGKRTPSVVAAKTIASALDFDWHKFFEDSNGSSIPEGVSGSTRHGMTFHSLYS